MALKTAEVDTKGFLQSLAQIEKVYSPEFLDAQLRVLALSIIADAVNSPVPRDTGALAESGSVEAGDKPGEVVFGFNRVYASAQDLGTSKLPPKGYGSDVGPNFYFSETVARAAPKALETIGKLIQAAFERESRRSKGK